MRAQNAPDRPLHRILLSVLLWAPTLAIIWGLLETSFLYMRRYYAHAHWDPASGFNLFASGLIYYALYGAILAIAALPFALLVGITRRGRRLETPPFLLAFVVGVFVTVRIIWYVRDKIFWGLRRDDPRLVVSTILAALVGAAVAFLLYKAFRWLWVAVRAWIQADPGRRRGFWALLFGVPVLFIAIGFVTGIVRDREPIDWDFRDKRRVVEARRAKIREAVEAEVADRQAAFETDDGATSADDGAEASDEPRTLLPEERPNVLLIALETTRADHINAYGYTERITSPNIDSLAEQGALFTDVTAPAPWTRPSMASLFSSLYPIQHGLVYRGGAFGEEIKTLPQLFDEHGYITTTIYTNKNATSSSFGFAEHMDVNGAGQGTVPLFTTEPFLISPLSYVLARVVRLSFLSPEFLGFYRNGEWVNRVVDRWLATEPSPPFFLHVHYLDPHDPYYEHPHPFAQFNPRSKAGIPRLLEVYDGEIRYVDEKVAELLETLDSQGLLENTIVVVLSDHGEEFHERGGWGHGDQLHGESTRVPLIFHGPGVPVGARIDHPASLIDVAPTVAALAGIAPPPGFEGRDLFANDGRRTAALAQLTVLDVEHNSWESGDWKLIRIIDPDSEPSFQLYNTTADPGEENDLSASEPEVLERLKGELETALADLLSRAVQPEVEELTNEELKALRALGYVN